MFTRLSLFVIITHLIFIKITTSADDQQHHDFATNNHNEAYNDNELDLSSLLLRSRSLLAESASEQQLVECKKSLLSTQSEVNQLKTKMNSMEIDLQNLGDMLSSEELSRNQLQKQLNAKRAVVFDLTEKLNATGTRLEQKMIACNSEKTTLVKSCADSNRLYMESQSNVTKLLAELESRNDKTSATIRKELKDMKDQAYHNHVKLLQKEDELQQALEDIDTLKIQVETVLAKKYEQTGLVLMVNKTKDNDIEGEVKVMNDLPHDSIDPLFSKRLSPSKTYVSKPKKDDVSKPKPNKVTYSSLHSQIDPLIKTTDKHVMFKSITDSSKAMTDLLHFETWSTPHSWSSVAIFTCALSETYIFDNFLVSTIRRSGYSGDLVVVVLPDADSDFLDTLKLFKATVYTATLTCSKKKRKVDTSCEFLDEHLPITLIRSFIYQYWALKYPDTTYIMMSDFRDVFFQSNPFTEKNKFNYWGPSAYDITFFAEHHPNRVISRCKHTSTTLNYCYGRSMTDQIGTSTIINNGVVFATRNSSLIYVSFISIMTILHDYNTVDD